MRTSNFGSISFTETMKGILLAIVMAIFMSFKDIIAAGGEIPMTLKEWTPILYYGFGAGLSYISLTFFQNEKGEYFKKEE